MAFDRSRELEQPLPPWVSVDQEGGRVARLKAPFTEWPPMATLGRSGDVDAGRALRARAGGRAERGRHHARLRAGARHPHQPEEPGHRRSRAGRECAKTSPGSAPRSSAALQGSGVAACGKHFPGPRRHDSRLPSRTAARRASARPRLREVEFVPFRAAIEADVATHHDRARARAGARRRAAGHAVADASSAAPARRAAASRASSSATTSR